MENIHLKSPLFLFTLIFSALFINAFSGISAPKSNNDPSHKIINYFQRNNNQCLSPVSIINTLAMLEMGAKNATKEEIDQLMFSDKTHEKIPKFFKDNNITKGFILANTVYFKDAWPNKFYP